MAITLRALGNSISGTTSLALPQPAGTTVEDVLVAFVIDHATSGTTTAPTGWTRQGGVVGAAGRFQVFTAVVGRNGLTGSSWTWGSLTTRALGRIIGYSNVDPTTPMDVAASARLNASGVTGTTSITTVSDDAQILAAFASLANGTTWQAEAVATDPLLTEQGDAANSTFCSLAISDGSKNGAGATGDSSATMITPTANAGILLALRPIKVRRTSKIITNVEYLPEHKARTSKIITNVEYLPEHKARTSKFAVMVEYALPPTGRVFGPPIGMG